MKRPKNQTVFVVGRRPHTVQVVLRLQLCVRLSRLSCDERFSESGVRRFGLILGQQSLTAERNFAAELEFDKANRDPTVGSEFKIS